jgi:hypothetical protein
MALYSGAAASLAVRFLSPAALQLRVSDGHLPYTIFNPVAPAVVPAQPAILHASTSNSSAVVRFLTALAPAHSSEAARRLAADLRRIEAPDWIGLERMGAAGERLLFRKGPATQPSAFDGWMTDAAAWFFRGGSDRPRLVAGLGVTSLKRGNEIWFASERPAGFAVTYQGARTTVSVYSSVAQTVRLRDAAGGIRQVNVEPGSHEFTFSGEPSQ